MSTTGKICLTIIVTCLYTNQLITNYRLESRIEGLERIQQKLIQVDEYALRNTQSATEIDAMQNTAIEKLLEQYGKH